MKKSAVKKTSSGTVKKKKTAAKPGRSKKTSTPAKNNVVKLATAKRTTSPTKRQQNTKVPAMNPIRKLLQMKEERRRQAAEANENRHQNGGDHGNSHFARNGGFSRFAGPRRRAA